MARGAARRRVARAAGQGAARATRLGALACACLACARLCADAFAAGGAAAPRARADGPRCRSGPVGVAPPRTAAAEAAEGAPPPPAAGGPWWDRAEQLDALRAADILRVCAPALAGAREQRCAVVRGALAEGWLGWEGRVAELCAGSTLSLFTPGHEGQNTFSRGVHRDLRSFVQPSASLWRWLGSSRQKWALRGELKVDKADLVDLFGGVGTDAGAAFESGEDLFATSVSLFSGAGGTRTPLHNDNVHAVIFQVEGSKRFFLSSRPEVADAVGRGTLPEAVLDDGSTDVFCVDGSLEEVHGLREPSPPRAAGAFVELRAGDALILPAWLYHDVEASPDDPASLSLTVRFELAGAAQADGQFDPVEAIKQYGVPALALHLVVWLGTVAVSLAALSLAGPGAGDALQRELPPLLAERLGDGFASGDAVDRAFRIASALGPARLLLTLVGTPLVARVAQEMQWFKAYDEAIWAVDNSLGGSLRESVRGAVSAVSRARRALTGEGTS